LYGYNCGRVGARSLPAALDASKAATSVALG